MEDSNLNRIKQENYKEQFARLKKSIAGGFNLEAVFIEYSIMEDRTEAILRHAGKWEKYLRKREKRGPTLNSKISYITAQAASDRKDPLFRYFSDDLLDRILQWKEDRNRMVHALLNQNYGEEDIHIIAINGKDLADKLRNRTGSYKKALERKSKKI